MAAEYEPMVTMPSPASPMVGMRVSSTSTLWPVSGSFSPIPYSLYCFMKFVIWLPARLEMTRSGLALRIFNRYGEKSATSVGTSSSAANSPPFAAMKRLATFSRSWPNA